MKVSKVYNCIAHCLVSEKMKATWSNSTWSIVGEVRMGWEGGSSCLGRPTVLRPVNRFIVRWETFRYPV